MPEARLLLPILIRREILIKRLSRQTGKQLKNAILSFDPLLVFNNILLAHTVVKEVDDFDLSVKLQLH